MLGKGLGLPGNASRESTIEIEISQDKSPSWNETAPQTSHDGGQTKLDLKNGKFVQFNKNNGLAKEGSEDNYYIDEHDSRGTERIHDDDNDDDNGNDDDDESRPDGDNGNDGYDHDHDHDDESRSDDDNGNDEHDDDNGNDDHDDGHDDKSRPPDDNGGDDLGNNYPQNNEDEDDHEYSGPKNRNSKLDKSLGQKFPSGKYERFCKDVVCENCNKEDSCW